MPYTDKIAEISFKDVHFTSTWKISIFDRDAYAGSVIDLVLTGRPCQVRYGGKGDLFDVIHGSELTINILAGPSDDYGWIKTTDSLKYKVIVYLDTAIYWTGFVLPGQIIEDYLPWRTIMVTCSDRLGLIDNIPYALDGVLYEGYDTYLNILFKALVATGLTLKIRTIVNLFESAMNDGSGDDPIFQASINQNKFINSELEPSSCRTVVEECLRSLKCRLFQAAGIWYIVRTVEYEGSSLTYCQYTYLAGGVVTGSLSVQRTITDTSGTPRFMLMRGTQIEQNQALKSYSIKQDYGLRESLLLGWNFTEKEWDSATTLKHFTISATSLWKRWFDKGVPFMYCAGSSADSNKYFESDVIAVQTTNAVAMTLNIVGGNFQTLARMRVHFMVIGISDTYYWDGSDWTTTIGTGWKVSMDSDNPDFDAVDHVFNIDAWPVDGNFKIKIFDPAALSAFFIKEIIVQAKTSSTIETVSSSIVKIEVEPNNAIDAQDETILFTDGNTDLFGQEIFYDGLIKVGSVISVAWKAASSSGYYKLWEWAARYQIDQNATPSLRIRGNILGQYHYYQSIVVPGLGNKIFVPDDIEIDLRSGMVTGTWIEVKSTSLAATYTESTDSNSISQSIGAGEKSGSITKITVGGNMIIEKTTPMAPILKSTSTGGGTSSPAPDLIRAGTETVAAGEQTIVFTDSFPTGSDYVLGRIWGIDADGNIMDATAYDLTVDGFKINFSVGVTFDYIAIIKR